MSSNAKFDQEIKKRKATSKEVLTKNGNHIQKQERIQFGTKVKDLKAYVWSVLMYGSECWTISREIEKCLLAVEMCLPGPTLLLLYPLLLVNSAIERNGEDESIEYTRDARQILT
ncbi:hypothetical protein ElyMa_002012300 [Elysia marginata]|uniref:Uncharacterized protein n=1 Tax=Elysia marginata TaxID=1093978 RepID=A0AAV4F4N4_9GAST|nr:hypothetical protein ElyMa_002012300 [Elysia marginata]